jgi:hypothetical protein
MKTSENVNDIFLALIKAKETLTNAPKNATNPFFKSNYADLATVLDTINCPLKENGLMILQSPCSIEGNLGLTTRIIHVSGQWVEESFPIPLTKNDPQALGSAVTYSRRYSLAAMMGITQEDDDGHSAVETIDDIKKNIDKCKTQAECDSIGKAIKLKNLKPDDIRALVEYARKKYTSLQAV